MAQRLTPISRNKLIQRFKKLGWEGPFKGSKHDTMYKDGVAITIPNNHRSEEISVGLLRTILNHAGVSREDWFQAR